MRHADKPSVGDEIRIDAPPDRVWDVITDLSLLVTFSEELQAVDYERPLTTGSQLVGTNRNEYFGEWQTTATVTECDPPQVLGWAVGDVDDPNTSWRFTLHPDGSGTRLRQHAQLGTGPSGLTIAIERRPDKEDRIVERRMDDFLAAIRANLAGVKAHAER